MTQSDAGLYEIARQVMTAALTAVDPAEAVRRYVSRRGTQLKVDGRAYDLSRTRRIIIVGGGKAGAPMAASLSDILGETLTGGVLNVKQGHTDAASKWRVTFGSGWDAPAPDTASASSLAKMELVEAGHPVPDEMGQAGAAKIRQLVSEAGEDDLVFCLISGGGSALLPLPVQGVTLADLQGLTDALLRSGATINEMNTVRKHCSQLKGGQLARLAQPASLICLILSDVVGNPLDVIASGPTVADTTTFADAWAVLERYGLTESAPVAIRNHLRRGVAGEIPDTPKAGDPAFEQVQNVLIGDNRHAAEAAIQKARELGLQAELLTTWLEGEAREVGRAAAALAKGLLCNEASLKRPACWVLGGETTVTVRGKGKGGRNQELALATALALDGWQGTLVAALATDGNDGPTDAAGAVVSGETISLGKGQELDALQSLADNDSYHYFSTLGHLIVTGPTNTNVNDLLFVFGF